jgi:hypothetical protein
MLLSFKVAVACAVMLVVALGKVRLVQAAHAPSPNADLENTATQSSAAAIVAARREVSINIDIALLPLGNPRL